MAAGEASQAVLDATADAVARTGIEAAAWQVVQVSTRVWPDASLGCPQPGALYAQILTPGYLIELRTGTRVLEYHAARGRTLYCRG